ncbi:MAG TPA: nucleotide sugar dehydrogenase [Terriglobales bacterium]|nr:nucleotide sugar dehydrogenase [Terriglobales bacterium]
MSSAPVPVLDPATPAASALQPLLRKIRAREARVGIIGLGYVGLPLAVEFARAGFRVTGFEVDQARVDQLNRGESYIPDVASAEMAEQTQKGRLGATTDWSGLGAMDTISICVPTPLRKTKDPDLSFILQASERVRATLRRGQLIVLESTTYPGTTDEVVLPLLAEGGMVAGQDFFLAFSPERVDPGNAEFQTHNIPKIVGGVTAECGRAAAALYGASVDRVMVVSNAQTAEMAKLLENTFRNVNIGLVNEMALLCRELKVNVWEVIEAAASKPFGFMRFQPGPGLGGHCIPIDPVYLSWKARAQGFEPRLIEVAQQINAKMPEHVVGRIAAALNDNGKALRNARIHVLGVAYKRDVTDMRESPALDVMHHLLRQGAVVSYSDPYVAQLREPGLEMESQPLSALKQTDCAVIITDHSNFDYKQIVRDARLIVDTRNALHAFRHQKIHGL